MAAEVDNDTTWAYRTLRYLEHPQGGNQEPPLDWRQALRNGGFGDDFPTAIWNGLRPGGQRIVPVTGRSWGDESDDDFLSTMYAE